MPRPYRDPNELERHIYFYRIGPDVPSPATAPRGGFDPRPYLLRIPDVAASEDRYLEAGERVTCCFLDSAADHPHLRVANIRRSDLPQIETGGVLAPLGIDEHSGLAEQIHAVLFENNVLGAVFNFYGPRPGRLADYLQRKCGAPPLTIDALVRPDVMAELDRLGDLRMMTLRLRRDTIAEVRHLDESLAAALDRTAEWASSPDIEIVLRKQAHAREPLPERLWTSVRRLAGSEDLRHAAKAFRVSGRVTDTGEISVVDILKSDIVATRRILRAGRRLRALEDAAAYEAVEDAYEELRDEIGAAVMVGPA